MNKAFVLKHLMDVRASYWFIPTMMVVGAILLSIVSVWIDGQLPTGWPDVIPFLFSNKPDGARSLLATVAGSMITVAGVTFSLTLLAVSHATSQFGPRLLSNFMRDRGNQITLGTFVSTFIYCLLVLRTVRTADKGSQGQENIENFSAAFVPHISVTIALLMTLCSVGVLIYFIHHVPESIRLSNVVSSVGKQLCESINELFPETVAKSNPDTTDELRKANPDGFFNDCVAATLGRSGYVQSVDDNLLIQTAKDWDVTIFLKHRPGDFYCQGTDLLMIGPTANVPEHELKRITNLFAIGNHRTFNQNAEFAVDQLIEVAQRALSPGVNDPMTAMYCVDWLKAGLIEIAERSDPSVFRYDSEGNLRMFTRKVGFKEFSDQVFDQLRQYVASDRNTSFHVMKAIWSIQTITDREDQIKILSEHGKRLLESFEKSGFPQFDIDELKALAAQV